MSACRGLDISQKRINGSIACGGEAKLVLIRPFVHGIPKSF